MPGYNVSGFYLGCNSGVLPRISGRNTGIIPSFPWRHVDLWDNRMSQEGPRNVKKELVEMLVTQVSAQTETPISRGYFSVGEVACG